MDLKKIDLDKLQDYAFRPYELASVEMASNEKFINIKCLDNESIVPTVKAIPLDKIEQARTQIIDEKDFAYADFERYKVEYLGQDWEDAYDSLPQDDFRYGMERCLEILDKLITESEEK